MKLLLLSFYYPPDLSAGSFRVRSLVEALQEAPAGSHLDVVTTLPNRYQTFTQQAPEHESRDGIDVHRVRLPGHRSDMIGQSRAFSRYAMRCCVTSVADATTRCSQRPRV